MKRSPLPRSTKQIARNVRPKAKRSKPRRVSVFRCRPYLDWLRDQKCVACLVFIRGSAREHPGGLNCERDYKGIFEPCDPAHGPINGASSKGPDNEAIPLCRHHHMEQHQIGWPAFEVKYGIDRAKEAVVRYAAYLITTGALPPMDGLVKP